MSTFTQADHANQVSPIEFLQVLPSVRRSNRFVRFERIVAACELLADLMTVSIAVLVAHAFYRHFALGKSIYYPSSIVVASALIVGLIFVLRMQADGAYQPGKSLLGVRETERILRFSVQMLLLVFTFCILTSFLISRWVLILTFTSVPLLVFLQKEATSSLLHILRSKGYGTRKVIIFGAGATGRRIFSSLVRSPKFGLEPIAIVDDDPRHLGSTVHETSYSRRRSANVQSGPLTRDLIQSLGAEEVIVAIPALSRLRFAAIVEEATAAGAHVSFAPQLELEHDLWISYSDMDGILLASLRNPDSRILYEALKGLFDFTFSFVLLILCSPLFLLITLAIRIQSRGPVLFCQNRVGKNGEIFRMYKFRTMFVDSEPYDYSPENRSDPRITSIGRLLRRTSLDELPQIFNVLKGEMALVGPRPEMPFIVEKYSPVHKRRLQVKPGLTGLWQLSADRAYLIHENIEYDLYYIRHRNFFLDFAVLLHTILFAMRGI